MVLASKVVKIDSIIVISRSESKSVTHSVFTSSFYAHRSQNRKKDIQVEQLFVLLGYVCIKAARKNNDEIDP